MPYQAPADTRVGHVHLRVSDLERAVRFYRDALGFKVQERYGSQAAFLSAGGYHHHIGLNTWQSRGGAPAPGGHTGLYHVAFLYPTLEDLRQAAASVAAAGTHIYGAADHGVSVALYFDDPNGNGVELYWDRAPEDWPRDAGGAIKMVNARFDIPAFLETGDYRVSRN
ncbi:MAG: VOC family protein [Pseudomonadota bacterium]